MSLHFQWAEQENWHSLRPVWKKLTNFWFDWNVHSNNKKKTNLRWVVINWCKLGNLYEIWERIESTKLSRNALVAASLDECYLRRLATISRSLLGLKMLKKQISYLYWPGSITLLIYLVNFIFAITIWDLNEILLIRKKETKCQSHPLWEVFFCVCFLWFKLRSLNPPPTLMQGTRAAS